MSHEDYYIREFEAVLDDFQWAFPDRSENRGEVTIEEDGTTLLLTVWTHDNENADDDHVHPLEVRTDINFRRSPEDNIRDLIHGWLCHEADEQMWFGMERPYYPHTDDVTQVTV
jgi:hypothetical protein